jgi:hypothetical protein
MRDHGIPVVMVTQDLGLQARSIAAGVPILSLSDESMLPPEHDDANVVARSSFMSPKERRGELR